MEEDDPVVQEVDVYLSHALADNLYLYQYPVRPAIDDYDDVKHLQAKVKPKQQKVEMELSVNTKSPNYDSSRGEQIVLNVDGKNPTSNTAYFKTGKMDKLTLTSSKAVTSVSRYAVGLLRSGELHLTPLHAIVQIRPSFTYLDLSDSRAKVDMPSTSEQAAEEEEEVKAVTVKFAGPQTEKSRQAKERSYRFMQQRMASEAWINTKFHPNNSPLSLLESNQLFCNKMDHDVSDLPGTCEDYIKALLPRNLALDSSIDTSQNLSSSSSKSTTLPDQIKIIMCNAKTVEFQQLLENLPGQNDANLVLRSLQLFAMLVQGCWVVKSELVYPKDSCSPFTGASAEILCRARDYTMWRFTQTRILRRKEVLAAVKIPDEDCKALFMEMSKPCSTEKGWEFLFPYDKEFVAAYPEVVQRQQMLWEARGQQMKRNLQYIEAKKQVMESKTRQRKHRKSGRDSFSDDTEGSGTDSSQTTGVRKKEFKAVRLSVNGAMDIDAQDGGCARFEISPTSLKPASELKQELLGYVKDKLTSKHCLTLSEMKQALTCTLMESPPGHPLSTGVTDKMIEETVELAGGQQLNNKWPQNTKPEPIFVFTRFGDASDKIREALVDVFSKTARIRSTTFQKKVEDELSETMSEAQTRKILQEYCVMKSGFYYLKGTISPDI